MSAQHKASLRVSLRSALKHKKLANDLLDTIVDTQTQFNALMDKVDADNTASSDTDYVASVPLANDLNPDAAGTGAQHTASQRRSLIVALSHTKLANEILDSLEELEVTHNALLAKLDAEAGTLNDIDYESTLGIAAVDSDASGTEAQHKASLRRSLVVALSHDTLANAILDAMTGMQAAMNAALVQLDVDGGAGTGALVGLYTPFKVTVLSPD